MLIYNDGFIIFKYNHLKIFLEFSLENKQLLICDTRFPETYREQNIYFGQNFYTLHKDKKITKNNIIPVLFELSN